jgi:integrase
MSKKHKTIYPGIRYREHKTRKYSGSADRYFFIRYRLHRKLKEEGLGWASDGWNAKKASIELAKLKQAHATGERPQTLAEKRRLLKEMEEAEQAEKQRQKREQITFSQIFWDNYFPKAKANKSKRSYEREESLFRLWISPVVGELTLKNVAPDHMERIKKNMADAGRAPRSIRYALAVVRQVFNFARYNNLFIGDSPTANVKMPQKDNRRLRFLTHGEAYRLLVALEIKSRQLYEMALVSLHCGARANEIFSLTWGDVDLERGTLTLRHTKNTKTRVAFMTEEVKELLAQKERGKNNDLVFPGRGGVKITAISNAFDRAVKELGLNDGVTDRRQKVVFHTLRHTYASWMVEKGVDLYHVKKLMGHSTLSMTERYSHLSDETLQGAVKTFEQGLSKSKTSKSPTPSALDQSSD